MAGSRCLELAGPSRVQRLAQHANVEVIRRRKDSKVVEIQVRDRGDDSRLPAHTSNPLAYVYREEVVKGLAPIFVLKHIPTHTRPIFRAVLDSIAA
jgi:hypothetical protein